MNDRGARSAYRPDFSYQGREKSGQYVQPRTCAGWDPYLVMKAGLCDSCRWQKLIHTTRGSTFSMCLRSKDDERFPKYPRLPVERCPGYEERKLSADR